MSTNGFPALCGGTFFALLLESAKQGLNERKKFGESKDFSEPDVFEALIKVAVITYEKPDDNENFKSVVSSYKSCNTSKSGRLPIYEQANKTTFNNRIKGGYQEPLSVMADLVVKYIDFEGKGDWLTRALIELVSLDENIKATDEFFITTDGQPTAKSRLTKVTDICFPAFLLGIWHFIIYNRPDNGVGKTTYDAWCKPGKSPNTRESFQSDIGDGITKNLNIFLPIENEDADSTKDDEPYVHYDEPFLGQQESETTANSTQQIINSPALFFNSGDNVMQINNTGIINIDRGVELEE
jgi:hypothetical protein